MNKDFQALLNAIARSSKASPVFVPEKKKPGFIEFAAAQATTPSKLFRFPGAGQPEPIVTGTRDGVTPDRTQSDSYKQYAQTPAGQFERYFKTPEMDQYFGAASRGTAAPKDVEAMQALAGKTVAPGKTPEELSAFYRAESAMGRAQMPEIQKGLGYAEGSALAKWAAANPMLAQRLYAEKQAKGEVVPQGAFAGTTPQPFGSPLPSTDFAVAANAVPGPWNTQGNAVSAPYAEATKFQYEKTTGEGMPELAPLLRAEQLIRQVKSDRGL